MGKITNKATVPQGMLAPSGYRQDYLIDPVVQSTTRPAGSLLRPSPGFDTVRTGKNRFQGKGPTGGFRPMEFAEDVGGSGAALSVVPGDTSLIEASEWLPESVDSMPAGSLLIADRTFNPGNAGVPHEARQVLPDMGDRSPGRPLSRLLRSPTGFLREDYAENKVLTVLAAAGLVTLAYIIGNDLDREYGRRRGGGVASDVVAVPASGAAVAGTETNDAAAKVSDAADKAVEAIGEAAEDAVDAVREAGKEAENATKKAADAVTE